MVKLALIAATSLLFVGCAITPIEEPAAFVSQQGPQTWRATGRFSYAAEDERQSGQFDWQQEGSKYQVRLFGPLGMGSLKIVGSSEYVEIQSGEGSYVSDQPDQLLFELTGMHIPINVLSQWMTGSEQATTRHIAQKNNWQILYDDYLEVGDYILPSRIDINQNTTSMRIAIADWNLD